MDPDLNLNSICSYLNISTSYFSTIFKEMTGETFIEVLTRIRMEKAAELMKDPDKKLETISFLVGYDDYNYFSRVFRKKMGCSPRDYRNNLAQL